MKKTLHLIFMFFILFNFSCTENELLTKEIRSLELEINVRNGILDFNRSTDFYQAMKDISDTENQYVNDQVLDEWEESIGFKSMRHEYYELSQSVEENISISEYYLDHENNLKLPINNEVMASILDKEGRVYINGQLHCFLDYYQFIVLDGDPSKLERLLDTRQNDEERGMFVFNTKIEESTEERYCGLQLITSKRYAQNKKLSAKWEIMAVQNYEDGDDSQFSELPLWTTEMVVYSELKSEKNTSGISSLFGNRWKPHEDALEFDFVYTVRETPSSFLAYSNGYSMSCTHCWKLKVTDVVSSNTVNQFDKPEVGDLPRFLSLDGIYKNVNLNIEGHKICHGASCIGVYCPPGTTCVNGECVTDFNNIGCLNDGDCPPGEICMNGECTPL